MTADRRVTTSEPDPVKLAQQALEKMKPVLTAHDRCDVGKCGARAYVRVTFETGDLYFCGHHGRELHVDMLPTYIRWHDETSQIGDKRAGL